MATINQQSIKFWYYNKVRIFCTVAVLFVLAMSSMCCLIWNRILYMVMGIGTKTFSNRFIFLLFQISHRVIDNIIFANSPTSLLSMSNNPPKTQYSSRIIPGPPQKALIIPSISVHMSRIPSHPYNKWVMFSTCVLHNLHIPSDNDILCSRLSLFTWPWKVFQLKSLQYLGIFLLTKFIMNHVFHLVSTPSNLFDQYNFDGICTSSISNSMSYKSFDDNSLSALNFPFGNLNIVFSMESSSGAKFSLLWEMVKHPSDKHDFIVCISKINPALFCREL